MISTTTSVMSDLLLIKSFNLEALIEDYRSFFLALLPSIFMLALLVEYLDRIQPFDLVKRAFISILILTSIGGIYHVSIDASMQAADAALARQKDGNILLMDMFDGVKHWDKVKYSDKKRNFFDDKSKLKGVLSFFKFHLFDSFINDGLVIGMYFIAKLCFLLLKGIYSLAYYLGYGLVGIPCLVYLFPTMSNVLRGGIITYLWCLVIPHVLVFIISMLGGEINHGYQAGQIIGGSIEGTILLSFMALFIAASPLIAMMILNGSGVGQAVGVVATVGANAIMNTPGQMLNASAMILNSDKMGPKMKTAGVVAKNGYRLATNASTSLASSFNSKARPSGNNNVNSNSAINTSQKHSTSSKAQAINQSASASDLSKITKNQPNKTNNNSPQLRGSHDQVSRPDQGIRANAKTTQENDVDRNRVQPSDPRRGSHIHRSLSAPASAPAPKRMPRRND